MAGMVYLISLNVTPTKIISVVVIATVVVSVRIWWLRRRK